jgi:hypothetical protein
MFLADCHPNVTASDVVLPQVIAKANIVILSVVNFSSNRAVPCSSHYHQPLFVYQSRLLSTKSDAK